MSNFVESVFFLILCNHSAHAYSQNCTIPVLSLFFKLRVIQLCVKSVLCKKLIVCTLLDNVSVLHDKNHIGILDSRQPVGDDKACSAFIRLSSAFWIRISVRVSTEDVASSRIRIGLSARMALAIVKAAFVPVTHWMHPR